VNAKRRVQRRHATLHVKITSKGGRIRGYRKVRWFETPTRRAFINITPRVKAALKEGGTQQGLCLANAMHITAGVFVNDDESGLHAAYERRLEELTPHEPIDHYAHSRTSEDNGDAHWKR
jgi:thiamine phosphate synthase YjbQ (UPF0047 family)